jgi:hypothetical protein
MLSAADKRWLRPWTPKLLELLPEACCEGPEQDREDLVPFGHFTPRLLRAAYALPATQNSADSRGVKAAAP